MKKVTTTNSKIYENKLMAQLKEKERLISELIELKPENDKLRNEVSKAKLACTKSEEKASKYLQKIKTLEEDKKKSSLEYDHLQHKYDQLKGQIKYAETQNNELMATISNLKDNLNDSSDKIRMYQEECRDLREKEEEACVVEKNYLKLQKLHEKLVEELDTSKKSTEHFKSKYVDLKNSSKELVKSKAETDDKNRKMILEIDKGQAEVTLFKEESKQKDIELEKERMKNKQLELEKKSILYLREQLNTKEATILKITQSKDEDIIHLHASIQEGENRIKTEMRTVAALAGEKKLLAQNLFHAQDIIDKLQKQHQSLEENIDQLTTLVHQKESEQEKVLSKNGSLEKQLLKYKLRYQGIKETRQVDEQVAEDKITVQKNQNAKLEMENEQLIKAIGKSSNENISLHERINHLEMELSTAETECSGLQNQLRNLVSELKEEKALYHINLQRMNTAVKYAHKPRRETYLQPDYSAKDPKTICHEQCVMEIKKLENDNERLKLELNDTHKKMYTYKKKSETLEEKRKVIQGEVYTYKGLFEKDREENTQLKLEMHKLKVDMRAKISAVLDKKLAKEKDGNHQRPVYNLQGQIINGAVPVVTVLSNTFQVNVSNERNVILPPIENSFKKPKRLFISI